MLSENVNVKGLIFGLIFGFLMSLWLLMPNSNLKVISKVIYKYDVIYQEQKELQGNDVLGKQVKILCWVMTNPNNKDKWKHIRETWGSKCSKLIFMSSKTYYHQDKDIEVVGVSVGNDSRETLWGKTKEGFIYVYRNHYEDYDWFMKADDDTYIVMENMRFLLHHYDPNESLYFGHRYSISGIRSGYMAGMAYILSKEALRRFNDQLMAQKCRTDNGGAEDAEMGKCLKKETIQVDTRDEHEGHRFFPVPPNDALDPYGTPYWYQENQFYKLNIGLNCCSDTPIGFHYIDISHMYLLNYLFYEVHPFGIARSDSVDVLPEKLTKKQVFQSSRHSH